MTDAPDLESVIETRLKDLLNLATEPKDLTPALKVAVAYYAVKKKVEDGGGWGGALKDE
jgi:hypothetical protein